MRAFPSGEDSKPNVANPLVLKHKRRLAEALTNAIILIFSHCTNILPVVVRTQ